jgi:predicted transcriptional regulator
MDLVAEVAKDYYSNDLRGGEGHMEVGKLIVNAVKSKAHITVSVKPFGCMPSSGVSDGVQSLIVNRYPGTIYCAVETSGDGATNFYSRVQMFMFKARLLAQEELKKTYIECGVTEEQVRDFLAKNPKYASPLHHAPHVKAGAAANLVHEVAPMIKHTKGELAVMKAKKTFGAIVDFAKKTPERVQNAVAKVKDPEFQELVRADVELVVDIAKGKMKERYAPLVARLAGKAYFENNPEVSQIVSHGSGEAIAAE